MNLVRSLNKFYGGQADRISIMAKTAYIGSKFDNAERNFSFIKETNRNFRYKYNSMIFSIRVWIL